MSQCIVIRYEPSPDPREVRIALLRDGRPWLQAFVRSSSVPLKATGDALLCFGLLPALEVGCDLVVESPVDRGLMASSQRVQSLVAGWTPGCRPVAVTAPLCDTDYGEPRGHGLFFSAGVDSSYSLAMNKHVLDGLVTLIGCDVAVTDRDRAGWLSGIAHRVAAAYGLEPIVLETDLPSRIHPYLGWIDYHGSALAGFRHLLADRFATMRIAASADAATIWQLPWGSHPGIDPRLGTQRAAILLDGTVARPEKIARLLDETTLLDELRVCYHGGKNCGSCTKCVLTRLSIEVLGRGRRAPSFPPGMPAPIDHALWIADECVRNDRLVLRAAAVAAGKYDSLVTRIDRAVAEFDRRQTSLVSRFWRSLHVKERLRRRRHRRRFARIR